MLIQYPCQRLVINDGHVVFSCNIFYILSYETGPFRDHFRRKHVCLIIAKGHGKMGGIGYDHIRFRDARHHSLSGHISLETPCSCLYKRISFRLPGFVLHLLLCHLKIFFKFPLLINIIENRKDYKRQTDHKNNLECDPAYINQYSPHTLFHQRNKIFYFPPGGNINNKTDYRNFEYILCQFHEGPDGKQFLKSLDRINL